MTSSNGNIFRVTDPLCGEFTGPVEFPTQRPVTRSFDVFFDLRLNKWCSKQPWGWWIETLSCSLWRHCNGQRHAKTTAQRHPNVHTPSQALTCCWSPFYKHGLTLIPAWISNYIHYKVWDEFISPFPNFNSVAVEVWEWISNFVPHFTGHVITYLCWD